MTKWEEKQHFHCHQNSREKHDFSFPLCVSLTLSHPHSHSHPRNERLSEHCWNTVGTLLERWNAGLFMRQLLQGGHFHCAATFRPFEGSTAVVTAVPTALLCRPQQEPRKLL